MLFVMCWAALRLELQEPVLLLENVKGVEYLISSLFSKYYVVDDNSFLEPPMFAFAVNRPRQYFALRHRKKTGALVSPLSDWNRRFHRDPKGDFHQFYWLHRETPHSSTVATSELEHDLEWAQRRPTCVGVRDGMSDAITLFPSEYGDIPKVRLGASPFELALNELETSFLSTYRVVAPHAPAGLMSNPKERCLANKGCGDDTRRDVRMSCLIKTMHLIFLDRNIKRGLPMSRWLAASEALSCQGFRTRKSVKNGYRQSMFDVLLPKRNLYSVRQGSGNSMSVPCVGTGIAHCLINILAPPDPEPASPCLLSGLLGQL